MLKYLFLGFIIKLATSMSDPLTLIPLMASMTRRRRGRFAFAMGNALAVCASVVAAFFFSGFLEKMPYTQYISGGLIFLLAIAVYTNIFKGNLSRKAEEHARKRQHISAEKFFRLMGVGFLVSFLMTFDDIVAFTPFFINNTPAEITAAMLGVAMATVVLITLIMRSSEKIGKVPRKKEIATLSLLVLGSLIFFGII